MLSLRGFENPEPDEPGHSQAPCASATATTCAPETPGLRTATAGFPDGTNARRAEAGLRFVF